MPDAIIQLVDRTVLVDVTGVPGPRGEQGDTGTIAGASEVVITPNAIVGADNGQTFMSAEAPAGLDNPVRWSIVRSTHDYGAYTNFVAGGGHNIDVDFTPLDATQISVSERLEFKFEQGGVFFAEGVGDLHHVATQLYRWRYDLWPHLAADRLMSLHQRNADRHIWGSYAAGLLETATEADSMMWLFESTQSLNLADNFALVINGNDYAPIRQIDAAGTTLIDHFKLDANDNYFGVRALVLNNNFNDTGLGVDSPDAMTSGGAGANDYMQIRVSTTNVTGVLHADFFQGNASNSLVGVIENLHAGGVAAFDLVGGGGGAYRVGGVKVVGAQGAAVADATDAPSAITQLNALLARCRAHGLIAT